MATRMNRLIDVPLYLDISFASGFIGPLHQLWCHAGAGSTATALPRQATSVRWNTDGSFT